MNKLASNINKGVETIRKVSAARRAKIAERRRTPVVRWSESNKRNEADEPL
jgi:hypothetical protein